MAKMQLTNPKALELLDKQKSKKAKEELQKTKKYEFYNLEEPGVSVRFCYGPTNKPVNYTLFHGGTYELPEEVADHIESRQTPIWNWRPDGTGKMTKQLCSYRPRFQMREVRG